MAFKRVIIRRVGPLFWLLEPMNDIIASEKNDPQYWLYFFPFWALPLLFCAVMALEVKFKLLSQLPTGFSSFIELCVLPLIAFAIFISGGIPILKAETNSLFATLFLAGVYYLFTAVTLGILGSFFAWTFLAYLGVKP